MSLTADLIILIAIDAFLFIGSAKVTAGRGLPYPPLIWGSGLIVLFVHGIWVVSGHATQSLSELLNTVPPKAVDLFWRLLLAEFVLFVLYRIHPIRSRRYRVTVHGDNGGMLGGFEFTKSFDRLEDATGYRDQMRGDPKVIGTNMEDTGRG